MCDSDTLEDLTSPAALVLDPVTSLSTAGAAAPAIVYTETKKQEEQQEEAIATAQRQQEELLESQEAEKKRLAKQKETRVAEQIKSALLRRQASTQPQLGQATGAQGIQDRILQLGKARLGGA